MKTRDCTLCHFSRATGTGLECTKGHKPRFCYGTAPNWCDTWKRRCEDYQERKGQTMKTREEVNSSIARKMGWRNIRHSDVLLSENGNLDTLARGVLELQRNVSERDEEIEMLRGQVDTLLGGGELDELEYYRNLRTHGGCVSEREVLVTENPAGIRCEDKLHNLYRVRHGMAPVYESEKKDV